MMTTDRTDPAVERRAEDALDDVVLRAEDALDWFESMDVVQAPTETELHEFIEREYVEARRNNEPIGFLCHQNIGEILYTDRQPDREGAARDLVFEWLRERDRACIYDPEMSHIYTQYETRYVPKYVEIADGYLDGLECDVSGDYGASKPAYLSLTLDGRTYEAELEWNANYVEFVGLHELLNRVLADTSARRRFYFPWMGDASGAFLPPAAAEDVQAFFKGDLGEQ